MFQYMAIVLLSHCNKSAMADLAWVHYLKKYIGTEKSMSRYLVTETDELME